MCVECKIIKLMKLDFDTEPLSTNKDDNNVNAGAIHLHLQPAASASTCSLYQKPAASSVLQIVTDSCSRHSFNHDVFTRHMSFITAALSFFFSPTKPLFCFCLQLFYWQIFNSINPKNQKESKCWNSVGANTSLCHKEQLKHLHTNWFYISGV